MQASLWVFFPTYNEVGNLEQVVRATAAQLETTLPGDWRLLVVDDASPDGTGELADRLAADMPELEVLHRAGKQGLGAAYLAGYKHALDNGAELVIVMDADFSHDPAHLPAMIEAAQRSDLVLGSRYVRGGEIVNWPPLRRLLSRSGSLYARLMLGVKVRDLTTGFRCVRRRVLEAIEPSTLRSQGYVFNIEFTYRALLAGFKVEEIPIRFRDREQGESKMSLPIAVEALRLVPRLRGLRTELDVQASNGGVRRRRLRWPRRWSAADSAGDPVEDSTESAGATGAPAAQPRAEHAPARTQTKG